MSAKTGSTRIVVTRTGTRGLFGCVCEPVGPLAFGRAVSTWVKRGCVSLKSTFGCKRSRDTHGTERPIDSMFKTVNKLDERTRAKPCR